MSAVREPVMRHFASSVIRRGLYIGVAMSIGLTLVGCSGSDVARSFGLTRPMPDEYTVTTRAPLSMPPSEKFALPGAADANRPDESPRMQALETLAPDIALNPIDGSASTGQTAFVGDVSKAAHGPNNSELGDSDAGFVDSLMFWQGGRAGDVVDSDAENRRIRHNSALGRPLDHGATPTMDSP